MSVFVLTFIVSCSGDDSDEPQSGFRVPSETVKRIDEMFGSQRLDSIYYGNDYGLKIVYDGKYLKTYEMFYEGTIYDGISYYVSWDNDTVRINNGSRIWRAAIGPNGLVEKLYEPSGDVRTFLYDSDNHLLECNYPGTQKYSIDKFELKWSDGNIVKAKFTYHGLSDRIYWYTYDIQSNIAALLPHSLLSWTMSNLDDVLYYAGLLGKGTANLPVEVKTDSGEERSAWYDIKYNGLVQKSGNSNGQISYFYK